MASKDEVAEVSVAASPNGSSISSVSMSPDKGRLLIGKDVGVEAADRLNSPLPRIGRGSESFEATSPETSTSLLAQDPEEKTPAPVIFDDFSTTLFSTARKSGSAEQDDASPAASSTTQSLCPFTPTAEDDDETVARKLAAAEKRVMHNLVCIREWTEELEQMYAEINEKTEENQRLGLQLIELIEEEEAAAEGMKKRNEALNTKLDTVREGSVSLKTAFADTMDEMDDVQQMFERLGR